MKDRHEFIEYVHSHGCKVGVEIGSHMGAFSNYILNNSDMYLYLVDMWMVGDKNYVDNTNSDDLDYKIIDTMNNIKGFEDRCVIIRATSEQASKIFMDEFFDFIYIDANHRYKYVKQDIELWYAKLKTGGILSGHDYVADYNLEMANADGDIDVWLFPTGHPENAIYSGQYGVNKAVDEFCQQNDKILQTTDEYLKTWFIIK